VDADDLEVVTAVRGVELLHIGGTLGYFLGLLLPFILVAAIGVLFPDINKRLEHQAVRTVGAVLFGLVGVLFVVQQYDDLASALFRISEF